VSTRSYAPSLSKDISVSASDVVPLDPSAELVKLAEGPSNLSKPERVAEAPPGSCFTVATLNVALASLPPQRVCGNPRLPFVFQGAVQDRIGARDNRRARTNNA
jgi:hypothetical protein